MHKINFLGISAIVLLGALGGCNETAEESDELEVSRLVVDLNEAADSKIARLDSETEGESSQSVDAEEDTDYSTNSDDMGEDPSPDTSDSSDSEPLPDSGSDSDSDSSSDSEPAKEEAAEDDGASDTSTESESSESSESSAADVAKVLEASLMCDDSPAKELTFNSDQNIELWGKTKNCVMKLTKFSIESGPVDARVVAEFGFMGSSDTVGADIFVNSDNPDDIKLVRNNQPVVDSSSDNAMALTKCHKPKATCGVKEKGVSFNYSILNISKAELDNDIKMGRIQGSIGEEPAPMCKKIKAKFTQKNHGAPKLKIQFKNCVNGIDKDGSLAFGIGPATLNDDGDFKSPLTIIEAHSILDNNKVAPSQKSGSHNYTLVLELDEFMTLMGLEGKPLEALQADFAIAIRNDSASDPKVSSLVYAVNNKCEITGGQVDDVPPTDDSGSDDSGSDDSGSDDSGSDDSDDSGSDDSGTDNNSDDSGSDNNSDDNGGEDNGDDDSDDNTNDDVPMDDGTGSTDSDSKGK